MDYITRLNELEGGPARYQYFKKKDGSWICTVFFRNQKATVTTRTKRTGKRLAARVMCQRIIPAPQQNTVILKIDTELSAAELVERIEAGLGVIPKILYTTV